MKKYIRPTIEIVTIEKNDLICCSFTFNPDVDTDYMQARQLKGDWLLDEDDWQE